MIWLLIVCVLGLVAFTALGIEDRRRHRALRAPDQS
ncbi:hypothetical protein SMF913_13167 [Streptomyces malaysiensis]|uniref:Uncharacterized protein n=1 Tax=Streptomyces malaysiensis TaxID=92644 RepID=A0A2J7ZA37_STRMQ|nr:hypothetical protein SMF913_13167 [Streptomyces malaysiensis]